MRNHLKFIHHKSDLEEKKKTSLQTSMVDFQKKKVQLGDKKYQQLNRALALACATDLRPLSMAMGKGFRYFCQLLNPDYKVPCSTTVSKNLLLLYEEQKADIISLITNSDVAMTTDLWTSIGARSYITVTGHFITAEWQYRSIVLATRPMDERHTGIHVADTLQAIQQEFEIRKLVGLSTDNAAYMKVAGSHLGTIHINCFAHGLQLAVQDGLKIASIKKALGGARSLVAHFSRSSLSTIELEHKQKLENPDKKPKALIQSVSTRWNSEYAMSARLLDLRVPVISVLFDSKITNQKNRSILDLSDASWAVLEDICPVLKPFASATEGLTCESSPTLSQVNIMLYTLVNSACKPLPDDRPAAKNLKSTVKKALLSRFDLNADGMPKDVTCPSMVAALLDPRYKSLKMLAFSDQQREELIEYVSALLPKPGDDESAVKEEPAEAEAACGNILDCLKGDIEIDLTASSSSNEIQQYLAEPVRLSDPLEWWRINENRYYYIAISQVRYFTITIYN